MNWHFRKMPIPGSTTFDDLISEYATMMAEGLEEFIASEPLTEPQPESGYSELPNTVEAGFRVYSPGPWYCSEFSAGFYFKGEYVRLGEVPYDITIERATAATYAYEVGAERPRTKFINMIDNKGTIS